jgi:hypothetical protein
VAGRKVKKAPYIRIYCGWYTDARVSAVSADAELVWLRSIAWSKDNHLDGLLPEHALLHLFAKIRIPPSELVAELETAGLWQPTAAGWAISKWADYQTTADEDNDKRTKNRQRQADWRAAQHTNGKQP